MTKALEIADRNMEQEAKYVLSIKEYMIKSLRNLFPIFILMENLEIFKKHIYYFKCLFSYINDKAAMLDFNLDLKVSLVQRVVRVNLVVQRFSCFK